jgi:hypothetical protein
VIFRESMRVCLAALVRSKDPEIAALASTTMRLQSLLDADPLRPDRLEIGTQYVALVDALAERGAFRPSGD